jgi:N-acetyl-1-D-myo-inositol-2-amino-2-deoxy-alpha-D-glucopyranoside deacetylase
MATDKVLVMVGAHPDDESFGAGGALAYYVQKGVKVYYICGTRGEVGEVPEEMMKGYSSVAQLRTYELECAAKELGLTEVIFLGYRDSGMAGSPDNKHPNALAAAPVDEVAGIITSHLRHLKPQVVVTFDPIGGYHHPDHIMIHNAAVKAFSAAGDPAQYPGKGTPYKPQKLYFHVFSHSWLKFMIRVQKFMGRDVHHFGKNKDIDLWEMMKDEFPINAVVKLTKKAVETGDKAAACHASQLGGRGSGTRRGLRDIISALMGHKDTFMRGYPPVTGKRKEKDLFEGVV